MKHQDKIGKQFGNLTILEIFYKHIYNQNVTFSKCKCKCGKIKDIRFNSIRMGHTTSCGCLRKETCKNINLSHNLSNTPEYRAWMSMKQRCLNSKNEKYPHYGGRGIKICQRWIDSFENFLLDVGLKPSSKHSLDRKNVDGNYTPKNCHWATAKEQGRNKQKTIYAELNGRTKSLLEWCEIYNVAYDRVRIRVLRGMDVSKALTMRKYYNRNVTNLL